MDDNMANKQDDSDDIQASSSQMITNPIDISSSIDKSNAKSSQGTINRREGVNMHIQVIGD